MTKLPTKSDFRQWRNPRRGNSNPQRMDNPFWNWCVQSRESAYAANQQFCGPQSMTNGPCWCFQRMGQAQISLPDGREVYIGGEHEDHYDPDFYIYNDVVIVEGENVFIYGYPESVFPPTDFHTATLIGSTIFLIGNLGYPADRQAGTTQVLRLDLNTLEISQQSTTGSNPGWIHGHSATSQAPFDTILITGGKRSGERITENFHDYELCLKTFEWKVAVQRNWKAWILARQDDEPNRLWEIRSEVWNRKLGISMRDHLAESLPGVPEDVIHQMSPEVTDDQIAQIQNLYLSPVDQSLAEEVENCYGRYRYDVAGTTVRFDEDMCGVTVTVEGELPSTTTDAILFRLREQLESLEQTAYVITPAAL